jgi:hypothetical protein
MSEVEGVDDDNEIEPGHYKQTLAATAVAGRPSEFMTVQQRTAKPPLIAIVHRRSPFGVDVRLRRLDDPPSGHQMPTIPTPIISHQLAELGKVARPQPQPGKRRNLGAVGKAQPLEVSDAEARAAPSSVVAPPL